MKINEIMSKNPLTITSDTPIKKVQAIFSKVKYWSIYVVDNNKIVGVITRNDLAYRMKYALPSEPAEKIMTNAPLTLNENDDVQDAIHLMKQHRIGSLAIINSKGKLCGIITLWDIQNKYHPEIRESQEPRQVVSKQKQENRKSNEKNQPEEPEQKQLVVQNPKVERTDKSPVENNIDNKIQYPTERAQDVYLQTDNFQEVIDLCSLAINRDPKHGRAYLLRGSAKLSLGNNKSAIEDFNTAIKFGCDMFNLSGSVYFTPTFNKEKRPNIVVVKIRLLTSDNYYPNSYAHLGIALARYRINELKEAKENLEYCLQKNYPAWTFESLAPEVKQMVTKFNIPIIDYHQAPWGILLWFGLLGGLIGFLFEKIFNPDNYKGMAKIRRK